MVLRPFDTHETEFLRLFKRIGSLALILYLIIILMEVAVFVAAPPAVLGWGERPSLRPDPTLGWRLIESKTTRLRWQSYDYVVTSNGLGFPGPEIPTERNPATYRIMTIGGGFTSAEGVDTDRAWPRVLDLLMNTKTSGKRVEVLNFAVTGFGPEQYSTVVAEYSPTLEPDVILVSLIPNDFRKVLVPVSAQAEGIGFGRPNPNGLVSILGCRHLTQISKDHLRAFFNESVRHRPSPQGMAFGQIWALRKGQDHFFRESQKALEERLAVMKSVAERLDSRLILLLVPASVQVCSPTEFQYFPEHVELSDPTKFDLEQPQDRMTESANRLRIEHYDLRAAFDPVPSQCVYQPNNLHWTKEGHQTVAEYVSALLINTKRISDSEKGPSLDRVLAHP